VIDQQLTFNLEPRPASQADDFLVADCNRPAVDWIDRFPDWPAPALILTGGPASGKSHLVSVFVEAHNAKVAELTETANSELLYSEHAALVFEDVDRCLSSPAKQETLFHLFNHAKATSRFIMLTSRLAPARWSLTLNDLASRLKACPIAEISAPDDVLLGALIVKHFSDRQLRIDPGVVGYAVPRIERSFAAVQAFVAACDHRALEQRRAVTIPLARQVLSDLAS
jgi:chromosomal replication initiation ATPase DnaA